MSDYKPPERPTQKLSSEEIQRGLLDKLLQTVTQGFAEQSARADRIEATVDTLVEDGKRSNQRMTTLEVRFDEYDKRAANNSLRVKQSSEVDLKHEAAIASEIVAREALAKDVAATKELIIENNAMTARIERAATDILSSPKVRAFTWALWLALAGWLASKGIHVGGGQ